MCLPLRVQVVSPDLRMAVGTCIDVQNQRVAPAAAELRVSHTIIEFYDPIKKMVAKWFPLEDIDAVVVHGACCGLLISRGSWKSLRLCCYVIRVDETSGPAENTSGVRAIQVHAALLNAVRRRRQTISNKALGTVLSHIALAPPTAPPPGTGSASAPVGATMCMRGSRWCVKVESVAHVATKRAWADVFTDTSTT